MQPTYAADRLGENNTRSSVEDKGWVSVEEVEEQR
jgi:hypothetical protein